jgi:hypothetical protein
VHRARAGVVAGLGIVALAGLAWVGATALANDPAPAVTVDAPSRIDRAVDAGKHVRIDGPRGIIHVWIPPSYHADTGATIIYLHGYYDDADSSWTGHQLPQQFAMSALNALFIVPEAPSGSRQPVNYPWCGADGRGWPFGRVSHDRSLAQRATRRSARAHRRALRRSRADRDVVARIAAPSRDHGR